MPCRGPVLHWPRGDNGRCWPGSWVTPGHSGLTVTRSGTRAAGDNIHWETFTEDPPEWDTGYHCNLESCTTNYRNYITISILLYSVQVGYRCPVRHGQGSVAAGGAMSGMWGQWDGQIQRTALFMFRDFITVDTFIVWHQVLSHAALGGQPGPHPGPLLLRHQVHLQSGQEMVRQYSTDDLTCSTNCEHGRHTAPRPAPASPPRLLRLLVNSVPRRAEREGEVGVAGGGLQGAGLAGRERRGAGRGGATHWRHTQYRHTEHSSPELNMLNLVLDTYIL